MPSRITWKIDQILDDTDKAVIDGMNETLNESVTLARRPFPTGVPILTGFASSRLGLVEAKRSGKNYHGEFVGGAIYTIWIELRYGFMRRAFEESTETLAQKISARFRRRF